MVPATEEVGKAGALPIVRNRGSQTKWEHNLQEEMLQRRIICRDHDGDRRTEEEKKLWYYPPTESCRTSAIPYCIKPLRDKLAMKNNRKRKPPPYQYQRNIALNKLGTKRIGGYYNTPCARSSNIVDAVC